MQKLKLLGILIKATTSVFYDILNRVCPNGQGSYREVMRHIEPSGLDKGKRVPMVYTVMGRCKYINVINTGDFHTPLSEFYC